MSTVMFLLNLTGATMLLLFAVRMVRTGIERTYGASFQHVLTKHQHPLSSSATGFGLAVILQSSAAVALLVAGFAASNLIAFGPGLAIVLGADFGSALVIQLLSFKLDWLIPLLLATGGYLFVKVESSRPRQIGRILMGIAFILLSLQLLRDAVAPIRDSAFLPAIASYLSEDYLTAFIVGAALAFVMHSSVATILMCVTLVSIGALPLDAGISLVIGANLGSAFIPLWLSRGMAISGRRIMLANLVVRGSWAFIALLLVNNLPLTDFLPEQHPGQALITNHLIFNGLLLLMLPFCKRLESLIALMMPERSLPEANQTPDVVHSALDQSLISTPNAAVSSLKRELLRMSDLIDRMFRPVMDVYDAGDHDRIELMTSLDENVNTSLSDIRAYVAAVPQKELTKKQRKQMHDLMDYAIALKSAGDIVARRLLPLAEEKTESNLRFSKEGWSELVSLHEKILANMALASNVLISNDLESARLLVAEKGDVTRFERLSRRSHLKRLSNGKALSFESSDIHLETLRAMQDFNSQVASIAYPILYQKGQLLETRLIEKLQDNTRHVTVEST